MCFAFCLSVTVSSSIFVSSNYFPKKIVACFWFWKTIFCCKSVDFERNSKSFSLCQDLAHDRSSCAVCSASRLHIISGALSSSTHSTLHWFLLPFRLYQRTTLFLSILDKTHQWCQGKHQGNFFAMNKLFSATRCID